MYEIVLILFGVVAAFGVAKFGNWLDRRVDAWHFRRQQKEADREPTVDV